MLVLVDKILSAIVDLSKVWIGVEDAEFVEGLPESMLALELLGLGVDVLMSGILLGAIGGISPTMGAFGLSALVVVIVGGLDSVIGALVAGLLIGLVEAWAGTYLGGEFKLVSTFGILILMLMIRPYGLFGTHEIERL